MTEYRGVVEFDLNCFTCEAPACKFLKCIKGYTGYTFEDTNWLIRIDTKFSEISYPEHQHRKSMGEILIEYDVNLWWYVYKL